MNLREQALAGQDTDVSMPSGRVHFVSHNGGNAARRMAASSVDQRMRLGMRCRLSPTADVPSHTSGAAMGQRTRPLAR